MTEPPLFLFWKGITGSLTGLEETGAGVTGVGAAAEVEPEVSFCTVGVTTGSSETSSTSNSPSSLSISFFMLSILVLSFDGLKILNAF